MRLVGRDMRLVGKDLTLHYTRTLLSNLTRPWQGTLVTNCADPGVKIRDCTGTMARTLSELPVALIGMSGRIRTSHERPAALLSVRVRKAHERPAILTRAG